MSEVQRICPECQTAGPLSGRYCPSCGYDFQGALPAPQYNLPVVLGKAAVPVLVGAASVALRIGWKLLQSRWAQAAAYRWKSSPSWQASLQSASSVPRGQLLGSSQTPSPV